MAVVALKRRSVVCEESRTRQRERDVLLKDREIQKRCQDVL